MTNDVYRYRARWLFPVDSSPLENGTLEVSQGRIVGIHARHDPAAVDLGNVALIPGLVNAHTHLEFSDLRQPLPPSQPFTGWIRAVVQHRRGQTTPVLDRIELGLREAAATGTTTLAEVATSDWQASLAEPWPLRTVVFRELLGLRPESITAQLAVARQHLQANEETKSASLGLSVPDNPSPRRKQGASHSDLPRSRVGLVFEGLSPHAPYSVHPELFRQLVALARINNVPVAMHLAETRAELELLDRGTGEFAVMLREFGVWSDDAIPRGTRILDYLQPLATLDHALVIHGNYLSDEELDLIAGHPQLSVVYCPRTHAYFGHSPHPWRRLRELGANVALGTDSRASNPDLSLWNELLFLRQRFPEVDPALLLRLGTINGASALGQGAETGTLSVGKSADVVVIGLPDLDSTDAYQLLFDPDAAVVGTMLTGEWISGPIANRR